MGVTCSGRGFEYLSNMAAKPDEPLEEDATELRFGKGIVFILVTISIQILVDFDNADALLVSEVKMLLEHRKAQHESQDDDQDLSEVTPIIR